MTRGGYQDLFETRERYEIMEFELNAERKARLVGIGSAAIDASLLGTQFKTSATAGPGAGGSSFFLSSGGHRVRLSIKPDSPLKVVPHNKGVAIVKGDEIIATGALEQPLCHCPDQAYITISERCVFDCKYCPVPVLNGQIKSIPTILSLVKEAEKNGTLSAISLTSGVADSPEGEVKRAVAVVRALREHYDIPIGVSVYPTVTSSEELFAAGANEIKYNVETMDREIFARVCPDLSLPAILEALEHAVTIFGKNHVTSNFILGLGESDEVVESGMEELARRGVIPILRPISPSPLRKGQIAVERPSGDRLLRLSRRHREILDRYGLDTRLAQTMCLPCTGCDLTPQRDV
ncbi:MAG: radical SAM protein [Methanoregula sp.]|nr:radical SAM protein [Methanoregula sp.]